MEYYYSNNPDIVGYIERIHMICKEKGKFDAKEQPLLEQMWQIVTKMWFSYLELNDFTEKAMGVSEESDENGCEGSVGFSEEDNVVCENKIHV